MRIVGMVRVRNESRWIVRCLQSMRTIVEHITLLDDHSQDNTVELAKTVPGVEVLHSPFLTLDEARDKDFLLQHVVRQRAADWVLHIDGDEELAHNSRRAVYDACAAAVRNGATVLSYRILYLWDSDGMVRMDGVYGGFTRPSIFRFPHNIDFVQFQRTRAANNLHCSNFPQGLGGSIQTVPIALLHYGYRDASDRQRKYDFYTGVDPDNPVEDGYKHIIGLPSRHAPGPIQLVPLQEVLNGLDKNGQR